MTEGYPLQHRCRHYIEFLFWTWIIHRNSETYYNLWITKPFRLYCNSL